MVLQEDRVTNCKDCLCDCLAKHLRSAQGLANKVARTNLSIGGIDDHEWGLSFQLPKKKRRSLPVCGSCLISPLAENQIEIRRLISVAWSPLNKVSRNRRIALVDMASDSPCHAPATNTGAKGALPPWIDQKLEASLGYDDSATINLPKLSARLFD